jgi:hypothetical protein
MNESPLASHSVLRPGGDGFQTLHCAPLATPIANRNKASCGDSGGDIFSFMTRPAGRQMEESPFWRKAHPRGSGFRQMSIWKSTVLRKTPENFCKAFLLFAKRGIRGFPPFSHFSSKSCEKDGAPSVSFTGVAPGFVFLPSV